MNVPEWDASKCVGCNQCAFVCSHATIRPFQLTADELAAAPAQTKSRDNRPANEYKFVMAVSPLDCMGCGECVTVCPTKAIAMVPQESQADQQAVFDYCVANISKKPSNLLMTPSLVLSSTSPCWSSLAPAQAVPRPLTLA